MATAIVKIKDWDLMEYEFGLDKDGDIDCTGCFTKDMEKLLPADRTITVEDGYWINWIITEDMVLTEYDNELSLMTRKKLL